MQRKGEIAIVHANQYCFSTKDWPRVADCQAFFSKKLPYTRTNCKKNRGCNSGGFPIYVQDADGNISTLKGRVTFQISHQISHHLHLSYEQPNLSFYILPSQQIGLALIFSILHLNHAPATSNFTFYIPGKGSPNLTFRMLFKSDMGFCTFRGGQKIKLLTWNWKTTIVAPPD